MALDANIISRTNLSGLIPEPVTREIIQGVTEGSAVLSMGRRLPNMSSKTQTLNVLDSLPLAYFVDGDTGAKKTTNMEWDKKKIYAEEIAVIVPIPEAVLDDSNYDIWGEVRPRITEAFGKVIDAAILFGTNKPASWRAGLVPSAVSAGNVVTRAAVSPDPGVFTEIMGVDGLIAKVEESGFLPTGAMAAVKMRAQLRGLVDSTGQPIFKTDMQGSTRYALDGMPLVFPMNGAFDQSEALMVVGDFAQLTYAIRQDITFKVFTEGVVQNTDGTIAYNLMQNDMVALRAVMRLGWEIPNPVSAFNEGNQNRFPFAVYKPAASGVAGG
jgi:HK97 family phage major capsid protein